MNYINYLRQNNYSPNTIRTYNSILTLYAGFFDDIRKIRKKLLSYTNNPNTVWTHYNVLLSFMVFKKDRRINRLKAIKLPPIPQIYRPVITKNKLFKITSDLSEQKNVVIRFLFITGIRCSEIKNIITYDKKTLKIKGKGAKIREIFHDIAVTSLLNVNVTSKTIRIWVKQKLGNEYSPHSLRRSHATHMLLSGANPKVVMLQLGHAKIETTYKYLQLNKKQNLRNYNKYF